MFCGSCGAQVREGLQFCPSCGARAAHEHYCTGCGAKVGEGRKFCPSCGAAQEGVGSAPDTVAAGGGGQWRAAEKRSIAPWIVAAVAVLLLALGGGTYLVLGRAGSQPGPSTSSAVGQASQPTQSLASATTPIPVGSTSATAVPPSQAAGTAQPVATQIPAPTQGVEPTRPLQPTPTVPPVQVDISGPWEATMTFTSATAEGLRDGEKERWETKRQEFITELNKFPKIQLEFSPASPESGTVVQEVEGKKYSYPYSYRSGQLTFDLQDSSGADDKMTFAGRVSQKGSDQVIEGTLEIRLRFDYISKGQALVGQGTWTATRVSARPFASPAATGAPTMPSGTARPTTGPTAPPTTSAQATPGAGQVDLTGFWMGTLTTTSASLSGVSERDQQAFQEQFRSQPQGPSPATEWEFRPSSPESGTVLVTGMGMKYRQQGDRITIAETLSGVEMSFDGQVTRTGSGHAIEGTFRSRAPDSRTAGTMTVEGKWSATRAAPVPLAISTLVVTATSRISPANAGQVAPVRLLPGHGDIVWGVAFSPDGKTVASGSLDNTVRLWEAVSGRELRSFKTAGSVWDVAFSTDGKTVASAEYSGAVTLWDVAGIAQPRVLKGHADGAIRVAFSPDGKTLASAGRDGTVRVWEAATDKELRALAANHEGEITDLAFSPDGKLLATAGGIDKTVKLWEVASGRELRRTDVKTVVSDVAFSPDMSLLAVVCGDDTVKLWELASGKQVRSLRPGSTRSVAFSPDGKVVAVGISLGVRLWETATGKSLQQRSESMHWPNDIAFSPDGSTIVSGGDRGTLILWGLK